MIYKEEFEQANERTKRFGLTPSNLEIYTGQIINEEMENKIPYLIRDLIGEISYKQLVAQCFSVHYAFKELFSELFKVPCYYTLGYVELAGRNHHFQSEEGLKDMLKNGVSGQSLNMHAWLTLPTMEIIDLTIATTAAFATGNTEKMGLVITKHADQLTGGMKYHPLLVGKEFLIRIGAVRY